MASAVQARRLRDLCLGLACWHHLVDCAVRQASAELLAFRAPAHAADLHLEGAAQPPFIEIGHVQGAVARHDGAQLGLVSRRIGDQRSQ